MKYTSYETTYNRHIKAARKAVKGLTGLDRAVAICDYFKTTCHPHPQYTFDNAAMNRTSDHQFAIDIMQTLADLTAKNEVGWTHSDLDCLLIFSHNLGRCAINNYQVAIYCDKSGTPRLAQLEHTNGKHNDAESRVFRDQQSYDRWVDELGCSGSSLAYAAIRQLNSFGR